MTDCHQSGLSRYQRTVRSRPSENGMLERQPRSSSALPVEPMCRSTWPGRSVMWCLSDEGFPRMSRIASAISSTDSSMPVATLIVSPTIASSGASHAAVIASAVSNTWSQSRLAMPFPWIVRGWSVSAWMMNRGMTFSGCWNGP